MHLENLLEQHSSLPQIQLPQQHVMVYRQVTEMQSSSFITAGKMRVCRSSEEQDLYVAPVRMR